MWRPEDWEKNKPSHMTIGANCAYEAGADAILEALKRIGSKVDELESLDRKGWRVFIPDDKGE